MRRAAEAMLLLCMLGHGLSVSAEPFTDFGVFPERREIRINFVQALNFGRLAGSERPGQVHLNAASGNMQTQGITRLSGNESIGRLMLRGEPNAEFQVWLPQQIIFQGPGDQLIARDLQVYPGEIGRFDSQGLAEIAVGGVLEVPPNPAGGGYRANFAVTVEYQ